MFENQDDYVMLDTTNIPNELIVDDEANNINRFYLQEWLKVIFERSFNDRHVTVSTPFDHHIHLSYELNGMRHTIYASSGSVNFSIDFVPGINLLYEGKIEDWHAIPKLMPGSRAKYSFMISNSKLEEYLMNNKYLKRAVLLVQALCAAKGLKNIYYYHLMNLVLSNNIDKYAKTASLQGIFIKVCLNISYTMSHI